MNNNLQDNQVQGDKTPSKTADPSLCQGCYEFFGNPASENLCSKCFQYNLSISFLLNYSLEPSKIQSQLPLNTQHLPKRLWQRKWP